MLADRRHRSGDERDVDHGLLQPMAIEDLAGGARRQRTMAFATASARLASAWRISALSIPVDRAIPESRPSVRFERNTAQALPKSASACSSVSAEPPVHSPDGCRDRGHTSNPARLYVRDGNAPGDRADSDVAIENLPAFIASDGRAAAGEFAH
jgi:hypothetical protein